MLYRMMTAAVLAAALATPAALAQTQQGGTSRQGQTQGQAKEPAMVSEKDIKGANIRNPAGDKIGEVEHVVLDQRTGKVRFAVVGVGGFLGVGEKYVAVPWERIRSGDREHSYMLDTDKQTLQHAPAVDMKNLQALESPQQQQQIAAFWRQAPSGETAAERQRSGASGRD